MATLNLSRVESPFESEMIAYEVERSDERSLWIRMECRGGRVYWVHAYRVITTRSVVFEVLEDFGGYGVHSSSFSDGEAQFGKVSSRALPAEIAALPAMSEERSAAVMGHLGELAALCRNQIAQAVAAACSARLARLVAEALEESRSGGRSDCEVVLDGRIG